MTGGPYGYVYDGNGLRVAKKSAAASDCTGGTVQKLYWRSLLGDAIAETDGSGSTTNAAYAEYVFFAGRRVASRVGPSNGNSSIFYYFADQLGSIRTITTGSGSGQTPGQLCYDQDYTPYGQEVFTTANMTRLQTTACPPSYKFTGYERDPETGLDYAFARYYSSRLGRFLSTDPLGGSVGDLQSHNAYAYVVNNPLNATDPSGMRCIGSGWGHSWACPDSDDNPYPGGGGGCGLDCLSGAGFAGMLGGGGYAGICPPEYQSCAANGAGTFIGIEGNGIGYNLANDCYFLHLIDINDCGFETMYVFLPQGPPAVANPFVKISVLADCIKQLFPGVTLADFEGATPGGKGSFTGFGPDFKTGHGNVGPIEVVNNAAKYTAAEIAALAGNPRAIGYTDPRAPYENYGNNNNNLI